MEYASGINSSSAIWKMEYAGGVPSGIVRAIAQMVPNAEDYLVLFRDEHDDERLHLRPCTEQECVHMRPCTEQECLHLRPRTKQECYSGAKFNNMITRMAAIANVIDPTSLTDLTSLQSDILKNEWLL